MYPIRTRILLLLWSSLFSTVLFAQKSVPVLEREVTITASNETVASVLAQIASQTGIKFSYSPTHIPADKKISFAATRKSLRTVLRIMFGETVEMKAKGNFVILTAKPQPTPQVVIKEITISGYVYDDRGEKLAYASILNKRDHTAAVSNEYGYYRIKTAADKLPLALKVVKEEYADTSYLVSGKQTNVDFVLQVAPKPIPVAVPVPVINTIPVDTAVHVVVLPAPPAGDADTVTISDRFYALKKKVEGFLSAEDKANIRNLKDTLFSAVQLSIIPQLSTSKLLVGNTVNAVSFSLLLGYSKGIKAVSIAGLANVVSGNARYVQAAGLFNAVEDSFTGGQVAGLLNIVDKKATGAQAAGLMNLTGGDVSGAHAAGLLNITDGRITGAEAAGLMNISGGELTGVQVAGLGNISKGDCKGVQVAGLFNVVEGNMHGVQIAGITNVADGSRTHLQVAGICNISGSEIWGLQLAGLGNVSDKKVGGMQIASVFNVAGDTVEGVQLAALVNSARHVSGVQIGLINVSDRNDGVSLGLFSYTRQGYHKVELFGDDAMYTQVAFRTGVQKLHNIFTAGVDLTTRKSGLWNFGYGLGSYFSVSEHWKLGGDLTSQVYLVGTKITKAPGVHNLFIGAERNIGKKCSIAFGPVYHVLVNYSSSNEVADVITPYTFYNSTSPEGTNVRMWVGGKVSVKFF